MIIVVVFSIFSDIAYASDNCQRKLEILENQLSYAKKYNNFNRIKGLERAISNAQAYCGKELQLGSSEVDQYYKVDQELEILEKIADAQKDLTKAEYKLEKAKRKGNFKDQLKAEYKIKEALGRIDLYEEYLHKLESFL